MSARSVDDIALILAGENAPSADYYGTDEEEEMASLMENEDSVDSRRNQTQPSTSSAMSNEASSSYQRQDIRTWSQEARISRQISQTAIAMEREETVKCIISSALFFIIVGVLILLMFLWNPTV